MIKMDKIKGEILPKIYSSAANSLDKCNFFNLFEIRFRVEKPVMLYYSHGTCFLNRNGGVTKNAQDAICPSQKDISSLVSAFCKSSVYAFQNEIKEGFITINGGHRVGISGKAVTDENGVTNIIRFSGVNIRIAREYKNCADSCIRHIYRDKRIYNTIIISPAGVGKTTVLRDVARQLSEKFKVSIIDERSELAASVDGVPQFDVGIQTDVLDGFPKSSGIMCALRSLSPDVIITDEIGTDSDIYAIKNVLSGGCKTVATMHGYSIEDAVLKKGELLELFERAILLERRNGVPEVIKCLKL